LRYIMLATSSAFSLAEDPDAIEGGFDTGYGCRCVSIAKIDPSIPISLMREDPVVGKWPALRAGLVTAAMGFSP
ncbi:MAG: hypothetical protein ABSG43_25300, partial [Solirubrobacteraceae bacterium]